MSPAPVKVLYHGSAELFDKIDVNKGRPRKDFGKGLYDGIFGDWWTKAAKRKALEALHPERLGVQWFVFKPQVVKKLVKSMEVERYD